MSIQNDELVAFTQQLSNMIAAGIPLSNTLVALEKQEENKELRGVIYTVRVAVEGGAVLSEALWKHPKIFSNFFISMIYAGEQGAGLANVLNRVAEHLEKEASLRQKVKGVFMYPMVMGIAAVVILSFLVFVIAPIFANVYTQLRVDLPLPTQLLLGISSMFRKFWWLIAGVVMVVYMSYHRLKKNKIGREFLERIIIHFPIFGKVRRKVAVARFVRTFSDMLICKVPLIEALTITDKVVGNSEISMVIETIRNAVTSGGKISESLAIYSTIFPPVVVQMTYAGEESGTVGEILGKCADNLDRDVEFSSKRMLNILEPSLTVILAGVVGFIALAIYLPMFDLARLVAK